MAKRKAKPSQQDITLAAVEALLEKHGGRVSPRILLDEARDEMSPFHDYFEWNDDEAGEQYRLIQAGQLLRRWKGSIIRIDSESKTIKVEAVRRVQSPGAQRRKDGESYETVEQIMSDPDKRESMIQTVLKELASYRRRYAEINALADVWRAIDDALELHAPNTRPSSGSEDRPNA